MSQYIKVQANTVALLANNTFVNSQCVRITNQGASAVTITQWNSNNVQIGTFLVLPNTDVFVVKFPTDFIASSASVNAVSVGFY